MGAFLHAIQVFFDRLAAVSWGALGIALLFHLLKTVTRTIAWRNVVAAAYPDSEVPTRGLFGAYVAGVGVNAVAPARGGDLVKLYLAKRKVKDSSYPALASTLFVETLFDIIVVSALLVWAIQLGVLPGLNLLPDLKALDWSWPARHPWLTAIAFGVLVVVALVVAVSARRRLATFKQRLLQGAAILHDGRRYLKQVVSWQALSWVFRLATVYFFLLAFGLAPTANHVFIVQVVQSVSSALPLTPGGAGTEQALLVFALAGKVSTSSLVAFSVGMQAVLLLFNVVLGFAAIALMLRTLRWRQLVMLDVGLVANAASRPRRSLLGRLMPGRRATDGDRRPSISAEPPVTEAVGTELLPLGQDPGPGATVASGATHATADLPEAETVVLRADPPQEL